jgi:hypothetical protein
LIWLILPASDEPVHPRIPWISIGISAVTTFGVGGIWTAFFISRLKRRPLVPLHDPSLLAALEHAGA